MSYKHPDTAYVHFHVTSGSIGDIHFMQKLWGKVIKYEDAIKKNQLTFYISKYASKTPRFPTETHQKLYSILAYKLQMHRFCLHGYVTLEYEIPDGAYIYIPDGKTYDIKRDKRWKPPPKSDKIHTIISTDLLAHNQKFASTSPTARYHRNKRTHKQGPPISNPYLDREWQIQYLQLDYSEDIPDCVSLTADQLERKKGRWY